MSSPRSRKATCPDNDLHLVLLEFLVAGLPCAGCLHTMHVWSMHVSMDHRLDSVTTGTVHVLTAITILKNGSPAPESCHFSRTFGCHFRKQFCRGKAVLQQLLQAALRIMRETKPPPILADALTPILHVAARCCVASPRSSRV